MRVCILWNRYCSNEHYSDRAPWLRAAVLGANDGLVSVASIMLGVGAGNVDKRALVLSGTSALVAGAQPRRHQSQPPFSLIASLQLQRHYILYI